MKTKILNIAFLFLLFVSPLFAQDVTTVRANSYDISDNLDLRAVASIFGESRDLEDFERRLNDPNLQISNLDLNGDNQVDYLRVIEVTENNVHLIILQAVLGIDTYQDVATIEVERDRRNNVQVQVVGNSFIYGPNYIYEPVYSVRPPLFNVFWMSSYRPYYSPWYWGYYPVYYSYWAPHPVYRYRNHVHVYVNPRNNYYYTNNRRSTRAIAMHNTRRANAYERQNPNNSFTRRTEQNNRYALEQSRGTVRNNSVSGGRSNLTNASRSTPTNINRNNTVNTATRNNNATPASSNTVPARNNTVTPARSNTTPARSNNATPARNNTAPARSNNAAPARSNSTPAPARSTTIQRNSSSTPAVRTAPARSNNTVRSAPAPQRQSAPSRPAGNSNRNSRG